MNKYIALVLLTLSSLTWAGEKEAASCVDFDGKKYQCELAYKNYVDMNDANTPKAALECRYKDGECNDIFIEKGSECKLIKTQERCEDAEDLYEVMCEWNERKKNCEAPKRDDSEWGKKCDRGEWYHPTFGCYDKKGYCGQYNFTNNKVCETKKDRLKCQYNDTSKICSPR